MGLGSPARVHWTQEYDQEESLYED